MRRTEHDQRFMNMAIAQAAMAADLDEVPVGAIVVRDGEVLATAHNLRQTNADPTAHAEILAIRQAAEKLGTWHLVGCTLYVTLEPCPMCAGALVNARVDRLVYGAADPKAGAVRSLYAICEDPRLNHRIEITPDVLAGPCSRILSDFFSRLRSKSNNEYENSKPTHDTRGNDEIEQNHKTKQTDGAEQ